MTWLNALPMWLTFPAGFIVLVVGADTLVRGASILARIVGISPLVVGLTVVAFGTSAPELAVSVGATLTGNADVAVGNVVGSNIMNVLLILGLSAIIAPLVVHNQLVRLDVPLMIGASILVWLMAFNGVIGRIEGFVLVVILLVYLAITLTVSERKKSATSAKPVRNKSGGDRTAPAAKADIWVNLVRVALGVVGLLLGAHWLVGGSVAIADRMGVSQLVIGLTVVAIGTSLPEIATSVMASIRGERDLAVGNVVGSNIFNILCVLGLTAILPPAGVQVSRAAIAFDLPVMIAVAVVCLPIFFSGGRISRFEGVLLLGYFVAYTTYLVLDATDHDASTFGVVLVAFVIPPTVVGLAFSFWQTWQIRKRRGERLARLQRSRRTLSGPA